MLRPDFYWLLLPSLRPPAGLANSLAPRPLTPPRCAAFESLSRLAMWAMLLAADDRFVTAYLQIACVRPGE
jgi:hypothetical protein